MSRQKVPARDQRLEQLRAFALFVRGDHTLYQIAQKLGPGFVERNPSTAAGRARTRIAQGWAHIVKARVPRWRRWWEGDKHLNGWQSLHGARLDTHPAEKPAPPPPEPTPFDRLLEKIAAAEAEAKAGGFRAAEQALRNMAVALSYNRRAEEEASAAGNTKR